MLGLVLWNGTDTKAASWSRRLDDRRSLLALDDVVAQGSLVTGGVQTLADEARSLESSAPDDHRAAAAALRVRLDDLAAALEADRKLRLGSTPPSEERSYSTALVHHEVEQLQSHCVPAPPRRLDRSERIAPVTTAADTAPSARASGAMLVLFTLASGQFLMTLDSSVMNVSIEEVAEDVGTTVTGIQGAITAYTLVMAALMITGAKIGAIIGRKRAFAIGCVIYGCGSFTTSIAQSLPVLLFGWSFLEGVGAALIMPAIVALVAGNFPAERGPPRTASWPPPARSPSPSAR